MQLKYISNIGQDWELEEEGRGELERIKKEGEIEGGEKKIMGKSRRGEKWKGKKEEGQEEEDGGFSSHICKRTSDAAKNKVTLITGFHMTYLQTYDQSDS